MVFQQIMQMTGDVKSRPSWRLSCHTYSYPECQLGRQNLGDRASG